MTHTETEMNSSSNYMIKESHGMIQIGKGNKDSNKYAESNQDLGRTLLNTDSIGTIPGLTETLEDEK